ncbi:MAG: hypothetical protein WDO72_06565 [Pseudomonadota bacterium]
MRTALGSLCLLVLLISGCGGGSNDTPSTDPVVVPPAAVAPSITAQPAATSVAAPATATLSISAGGTAPLTYQWRSSTDGTTWIDIAGATGASYVTSATDVGMNGRYFSVVVSNSAGSVTSGSAQLTVIATTPPDPGGGGGGGSGPSGEFPHAANPFTVAVTPADNAIAYFDVASSTDATVQVPGGAADIAVAEGVTATIGIPGNAFLEDQSLAVTQVLLAAVDSAHPLPLHAVRGAFHLDPADAAIPELQTNNRLRITFTLTQAALDALGGEPVIFSARADGTQLHLVPVYKNADGAWSSLTLTTVVDHLGLFGIATLDDAQADLLSTSWPAEDSAQLEAALAPPSYGLRKAELGTPAGALAGRARLKTNVRAAAAGNEDWYAQMRARVDAYYNDVVAPAVAAANAPDADLAQFRDATQKLFTWARERQLLGIHDEADSTTTSLVTDYTKRGIDIAMQDCSANRNSAAVVQLLGMLRQAALLGVETVTDLDWVMNTCGRSTYDISIDWNQIHTYEIDYDNPNPETAFTGKLRESFTTSGKLHKAEALELTGTRIEQSSTYEAICAEGAWRCRYEKFSITADDSNAEVQQCGVPGFFVSYRVDRWNLDARGHNASPYLYLWFQNANGCADSSFLVGTPHGTKTSYDISGNATQTTVYSSDSVDTRTWSGGANLGSSSRIVRASAPITGTSVAPGATQRWTTSLKIKVTEVVPVN